MCVDSAFCGVLFPVHSSHTFSLKGTLMKTLFILPLIIFTFAVSYLFAGDTVKEEQVKVFGNCKQCKDRIESTLKIKEVKFAKWDKKSKMLRVAYQSDKISLDSLQQLVASVGHDTEKFKAPDSVYSELPGCCLYRDGEHTH
jgi:hypothetical protein